MDTDKLVASFDHYLALEGNSITRAVAEQRMLGKLARNLTEDIAPLLPAGGRRSPEIMRRRIRVALVPCSRVDNGVRNTATGKIAGSPTETESR